MCDGFQLQSKWLNESTCIFMSGFMCETKMETHKQQTKGDERNTVNNMTIRKKKTKKKVFAMACEQNCMGHYYMNELFFSVIKA